MGTIRRLGSDLRRSHSRVESKKISVCDDWLDTDRESRLHQHCKLISAISAVPLVPHPGPGSLPAVISETRAFTKFESHVEIR